MKFNVIDFDKWERTPYFNHFSNNLKCTYSITSNIDITALLFILKEKQLKFYPTFIYIISKVVNSNKEFRFSFDNNKNLGYFEEMNPCYTIFHEDDKTFSNIWSEYSEDFSLFYKIALNDLDTYKNVKGINAKDNQPLNVFPISCTPWVTFTGFNLNVYNDGNYLLPIITIGKFFKENNKTLLPLALQCHHGVADGYHSSKFINDVQYLALNYNKWLNL